LIKLSRQSTQQHIITTVEYDDIFLLSRRTPYSKPSPRTFGKIAIKDQGSGIIMDSKQKARATQRLANEWAETRLDESADFGKTERTMGMLYLGGKKVHSGTVNAYIEELQDTISIVIIQSSYALGA